MTQSLAQVDDFIGESGIARDLAIARGLGSQEPSAGWLLTTVLDELDYGVALLGGNGSLIHANSTALRRIEAGQPLCEQGGRLYPNQRASLDAWEAAMRAALHGGQRRLVTLGKPGHLCAVALVPLGAGISLPGRALLVLGRQGLCEALSAQCFARNIGLTDSEAKVWFALTEGLSPVEIAKRYEIALSTVRTHLNRLREKTGMSSLRSLQALMGQLPPMMSAIRPHRWRNPPWHHGACEPNIMTRRGGDLSR